MNELLTYKETDLHDIHTLLGAKEAELLKLKAAAVAHFLRASNKHAAADYVARVFGSKLKGITLKSLYRLAKAFQDGNGSLLSLMDRRQLRRLRNGGLVDNPEFVAYWHQLCLENKRATAAAYRELFRRLRAGDVVPGYGDWRAVFAGEHGGIFPAPDRACPYEAGIHTPKGWTLRNLTRIKPDEFALVAARKGVMAATMEHLPDIKRTRVGLKCCRVVQIDDMWYEHKVAFGPNKMAQRVVEFSMIDVATGKVFAYLPKPVFEKEDGHREVLKSAWTRYLIAYLLGTVGVPDEGVQIMGEHGTASADGALEETLARLSGGRIQFGAGGLLSNPLYSGSWQGTPKGNPRYKGLLEGFHSLIKNELAHVDGHMGGGREAKGEFVYGMEKTDNMLRSIATALEQTRPGIRSRITMPFMDYYDFRAIIDMAYDSINGRRDHQLEGWEGQGFMMAEYFDAASACWVPVARIAEQPQPIQVAMYQAINDGTFNARRTRLSPTEAWDQRAADRTWKVDPAVLATEVLGPQLSVTCLCDPKLTLHYKDYSSFTDCEVTGILDGGGSLTRGQSYLVWINPFDPLRAFVADMTGKFIGTAMVKLEHRYDDIEGIKRDLGVRNAALAAERRRIQPTLNRMARKAAAVQAANAREILGEDPALTAAVSAAAEHELGHAQVADLDFSDEVETSTDTPDISGDEIADL